MKDCRTFLRLQSALDPNQGARQGEKSTSQGYQVQRLAKHLESKVYISAMIQPVPKSKKEQKSISRQVNLAISSPPATTKYLNGPINQLGSAEQITQGKYQGRGTRQWC
jgi:hypothetical protein